MCNFASGFFVYDSRMKKTKTVTGKNRIVKSITDLRKGDTVQRVEGRRKSGQVKLSQEIWHIDHIHLRSGKIRLERIDVFGEIIEDSVTIDQIRLHTITDVEISNIMIKFYCRKSGRQSVEVSRHAFSFGEQECEMCGSHGHLNVDVKCGCGKTHNIELKSW